MSEESTRPFKGEVPETSDLDTEAEKAADQHLLADLRVRQYTMAAMAVGLVPVPLVDLAGLFAIQVKLLHSLARAYGVPFRADLGRAAIASLVGGAIPVSSAPTLGASLGKVIPGYGQTVATGTLVVLNGAVTYALGKVFIQHFASGGTLLTFDPEAVREYFKDQLAQGREHATRMRGNKESR